MGLDEAHIGNHSGPVARCRQVLLDTPGGRASVDMRNDEDETPMMAALMALHQVGAPRTLTRSHPCSRTSHEQETWCVHKLQHKHLAYAPSVMAK